MSAGARLWGAVPLAAALLCACTKPAPAPTDTRIETVHAWAKRYAPENDHWRHIIFTDVAALLLDRKVGNRGYPLIRYRMKYENFEAAEADGQEFRSTAVTYEADCSQMLHRIVQVTAYERLGLKGASFEAANPVPDWSAPEMGSEGYLLTALACRLAQPAVYDLDDPRLIRFDPPAVAASEIAALTWVRQNRLDADGWSMIGSGRQTAEFISDRAFDFDAYPLVRYDAKTEFFHPVEIGENELRSEKRRIEVDCEQRRQRDLSVTYYEGQNLSGVQTVAPDPGGWSAPAKTMPRSQATACLFAFDLKYARNLTAATAAGKDLF